jgi:hypothetical protein
LISLQFHYAALRLSNTKQLKGNTRVHHDKHRKEMFLTIKILKKTVSDKTRDSGKYKVPSNTRK